MNVSGIRPYEGFYQYNSIRLNELRNRQIADAQQMRAPLESDQPAVEETDYSRKNTEVQTFVNQNFDSFDFAQMYRPDETFDLKGMDSDINSLDAEKAVSDLSKDQILQQYQYFVGNDVSISAKQKDSSDAEPRSGENFFL